VVPTDPSPETGALLDRADAICLRRGARLTTLRRQVLALVLESPRPTGAYELLDRLRGQHKGAAPPTVYRALDFLLEQGLIHKVERLAAYIGCIHGIADGPDHAHVHAAQFLICQNCQQVTELNDPGITRALLHATGDAGFALRHATIEADGLCAACLNAPAHSAAAPSR
jgi:Fur family zinc uptake transcriptional regulator